MRVKFTYLVLDNDGTVKKKTCTCKERCTEDYEQDPFERFQQRHPTACDIPHPWQEREDRDTLLADVLKRGWMPEVRDEQGSIVSRVGTCYCIIVDWVEV